MKLLPQTADGNLQSYLNHLNHLKEEMIARHSIDVSRVDGRVKRPLDYGIHHQPTLNTGQVHSNKVKKCRRTINSEEAITPTNGIHTVECNRDDNHHNERDEEAPLQLSVKKISSNLLDKVNSNYHSANQFTDETVARELVQVMKYSNRDGNFRSKCTSNEKMNKSSSSVKVDIAVDASASHLLFSSPEDSERRLYTRSLAGEKEKEREGENEREEDTEKQQQQQKEEEKKEKREEMKVSEVERGRKEIGGEVKDEMRGGERSLETQWPARYVKAESSGVQSLHQCKRKDQQDEEEEEEEEENCEKKKNTDHSNNGNSNDSGAHSGEKRHHQSKSHHSHSREKHEETRHKKQTDRHSLTPSTEVTCNIIGNSSSRRLFDEMSKSSSLSRYPLPSSTCLSDSPSPRSSGASYNEPSSHSNATFSCISANIFSPASDSGSSALASTCAFASAPAAASSSARPSGSTVLPVPLILPVPFPVPIPIFLLKPDLIGQINEIVARSNSDKNNSLANSDPQDNKDDNKPSDTKQHSKINFLPRREHMSRDNPNEENVCR